MKTPVHILSISDDEGVRVSREMLLRRNGYEVESVESQEFLGVGYVRRFKVALICTSIPAPLVGPLMEKLIRYNPSIQIIEMEDLRFNAELWFDVNASRSAGPDLLLEALKEASAQNARRTLKPDSVGRTPMRWPSLRR